MSDVKTIVLVGVGGQGTILVSKVLTTALMNHGYDVKMSEVHGMAQRGGSVFTQVRYGKQVHSPLVGDGAADALIAFERMEAARGARFLKKDGVIIVNDRQILPLPVATGQLEYPQGILESLKKHFSVIAFDATKEAEALGMQRTMNIVLLGATAAAAGLDDLDFDAAMEKTIPARFLEINRKAFAAGRELGKRS
jgi:indolepyruvate ferredoxin oxidoreductase beta subunit